MDDVDLVPHGWIRYSEFAPKSWRKDIRAEREQLIADFEAEYGITLTRQRHLGIVTCYFGVPTLSYLDAESLLARIKYLVFEQGRSEVGKGLADALVKVEADPTAIADDADIDTHRARFR